MKKINGKQVRGIGDINGKEVDYHIDVKDEANKAICSNATITSEVGFSKGCSWEKCTWIRRD